MKYFSSSIAEKKLSDFQKYDASLNKFEERLELVKTLIHDKDEVLYSFFSTYFEEYYEVSPSQNGTLAEEDAVCKTIEGLGTYLLNSKDIESNRKVEYRFWKSKKEYSQYKESKNINASTLEAGLEEGSDTTVIDMFYSPDEKNHKVVSDIKVYAKDLSDIREIRVLQELIDSSKSESFIKSIENKIDEIIPLVTDEKDLSRLKNIRGNVAKFVASWASNCKENQILIKKVVKRPIEFRNVLKDEGAPNKLDAFDYMEEKDIVNVIPYLSRGDLMSDFGIIIHDINNLINKTKLSDMESKVVGLFREGYTQSEIVEELDVKKQNLKTYINRIGKKVAKTYENEVLKYRDSIRQKKV